MQIWYECKYDYENGSQIVASDIGLEESINWLQEIGMELYMTWKSGKTITIISCMVRVGTGDRKTNRKFLYQSDKRNLYAWNCLQFDIKDYIGEGKPE